MASQKTASVLYPSLFLLVIFLAPLLLLGAFSVDLYIPYVPLVPEEFNCSFSLTQLTVTIPMLMMGLSQIFWGRSVDHLGMVKTLACALSFFFVGSFLCWQTDHIGIFLLGRAFQGIGACGAHVFSLCLARMMTQEPHTSIILGRLFGLAGIAPIIAPFLGLAMTQYIGSWRGIFLFLIVYTLTIAMMFILFYKSVFQKPIAQYTLTQPPVPVRSFWGDLKNIFANRDFKAFFLAPALMLLGLILFFTFSTYYLQHTQSVEPWAFRIILSTHAAIYVLSSFILAPFVGAHADVCIPIGMSILFCIYTSLYIGSHFYLIPLPIFLGCVFTMSMLYGALYGPSIQRTLRSIKHNAGLATSMLGTLQFTAAGLITTFAFSSQAAEIAHYVSPLVILSGLSLLAMLYYRKTV